MDAERRLLGQGNNLAREEASENTVRDDPCASFLPFGMCQESIDNSVAPVVPR